MAIEDIVNENIEEFNRAFWLDWENKTKYIDLFKRGLASGDTLGLFFIKDSKAILELANYYKDFKKIIIYDAEGTIDLLKDYDSIDKFNDPRVKYIYAGQSLSMKFDKIIMNPPYSKNLHLKILREAMKCSKDIVNLSPIRWLQDPLAEYKNNSDWKKFEDIRGKIENLDIVNVKDAASLLGAGVFTDLGIYHITEKGGFDTASLRIKSTVLDKVLQYKDRLYSHWQQGFIEGKWNVKVAEVRGFGSGNNYDFVSNIHMVPYNKLEDYIKTKFQKADAYTQDYENENFVVFDTLEEGLNFTKSTHTDFYHYLIKCWKLDQHVPLKFLPFMPTYTHPWTDKDLYDFFNLTPEEINEIEYSLK